jgi:hypothetical protein
MKLSALLNLAILLALAHQHFRMMFKIAYYETKLDGRSIYDGVRKMAWWKVWMKRW